MSGAKGSMVGLVLVLALADGSPAQADLTRGVSMDAPAVVAVEYLDAYPGGSLVTPTHVVYPDGTGFVAEEAGTLSVSQCASGRFCTWTSPNLTGSFSYVSGSGVTRALPGSVTSFWNNRGRAARLFNSSGSASTCYAPGVKKSSLPVAYQSPTKVVLSSGTGC